MNFMNKWPRRLLATLVVFVLLAGLMPQKKGFALSEALLFPLFSFSCRVASPAQCMSWPFSDTATTPALPPS